MPRIKVNFKELLCFVSWLHIPARPARARSPCECIIFKERKCEFHFRIHLFYKQIVCDLFSYTKSPGSFITDINLRFTELINNRDISRHNYFPSVLLIGHPVENYSNNIIVRSPSLIARLDLKIVKLQ